MVVWEQVRCRGTIHGLVKERPSGRAVGGALVEIISPAPLAAQSHSAADGHFHFMELPEGEYSLRVSLPGSGSRYGKPEVKVNVSTDAQGNAKLTFTEIALPATSLKGKITSAGDDTPGGEPPMDEPVVMAEIKLKGSGEQTFSDGAGEYLLSGVEAGKNRTLLISARGYRTTSQPVDFSSTGVIKIMNIKLDKE
ncbi:MAG: carboxypeptidase regulatory-like domain-containing protein [Anaerolineaceae bacterium]|nr:carboxypeptidase regulatory-like domain-containing protein [Anaerolineaceae bacterium]